MKATGTSLASIVFAILLFAGTTALAGSGSWDPGGGGYQGGGGDGSDLTGTGGRPWDVDPNGNPIAPPPAAIPRVDLPPLIPPVGGIPDGKGGYIDPNTGQPMYPTDPRTGQPVTDTNAYYNSTMSGSNQAGSFDDNAFTGYNASKMTASQGMLLTLQGLAMLNSNSRKAKALAGEYLNQGALALTAADQLATFADQNAEMAEKMANGLSNGAAAQTNGSGAPGQDLELDEKTMKSGKAEKIYEEFDSTYSGKSTHDGMIAQIQDQGLNSEKMEQTLGLPGGAIDAAKESAGGLSDADKAAAGAVDQETLDMIAALKKEAGQVLKEGGPDEKGADGMAGQAGADGLSGNGMRMGDLASTVDALMAGAGGAGGAGGGGFDFKRGVSSAKYGEFTLSERAYLGTVDLSLFKRVRKKHREKEDFFRAPRK